MDTLTISIVLGDPLTLTETQPVGGTGTITFADGQPSEVLDLEFQLFNGDFPDAVTFTGDIMNGTLNYLSTSQTGQITLDGNGDGSSTYTVGGQNFQFTVTIVGRSSSYPLPTSGHVADISVYS
jgi:hypothetical protein